VSPFRDEKISQIQYRELFEISLAINAELNLEDLLGMIVHSTRRLTGCDEASIVLWCERQGCFKVGASTNIGSSVSRRVRGKGGASRWVVDNGKPVVVEDTRHDPFVANPMIPEAGILAYVGVPILEGGRAGGVLYALHRLLHRASPKEIWVLEQLAAIAAAAVRNADLVESLQELNTFKSMMVRMLAHDLCNPLGAVQAGLDLLLRDLGGEFPEACQLLTMAQQAVLKMEKLTNAVLAYEKIDSVTKITRERLDLLELARETVDDFIAAATVKSQTITLKDEGAPVPFCGNRALLRQAIDNLAGNAVRFAPVGGHITVRAMRQGQHCLLEVEDDGPGIAPEDRESVFRPFFRLNGNGTEPGNGLGLSLVKLIMERHAGTVEVRSAPGQGSIFGIRLPALEDKARAG